MSSLKEELYLRSTEVPLTAKVLQHLTVCLNGLEVLCLMVDRMGEHFKPHVTTVLPAVIDRLGDSKDQVREVAQQFLLKLMMPASTPQYVFDRLGPAFQHKLWHVKEGVLITLQNTINRYGARCLLLSKIVPDICKLLDDPSPQVREAAVNSLVEIYRHVGEKVRNDLKNKGLTQQRLTHLNSKFEEVKLSGNMLPTADITPSRSSASSSTNDEPDYESPKPTQHRTLLHKKASSVSSGGSRRVVTSQISTVVSAASGAVDEELFIKSFKDVPNIKIYSSRDIQEHMVKIKETLLDSSVTWEKRIDHIKVLRSLLVAGAGDYDDFYQCLRTLESAFMMAVKDLRSQVVREACVTIAYLSQQLGSKLDHFAESVLPSLINLIPNSAKVMSTSGIVAIRFIMQFVHTSRLIPIITNNLSSKSSTIRRFCQEFVNQILHSWPTHCLEKHIAILQDGIKKGLSDADAETRAYSRKAFWGFSDHFKSQADALLSSLDPSKQKLLQGEVSNSSSSSSLNGENVKSKSRSRTASEERTTHSGLGTTVLRRPLQRVNSSKSDAGAYHISSPTSLRSGGFDFLTPNRGQDKEPRIGLSLSQPNSRSHSPSSARRLPVYIKNTPSRVNSGLGPRKSRTSESQSQGASRETSPARSFRSQGDRRSNGGISRIPGGRKTPVMAQRILKNGSHVEDALKDALVKGHQRKRYEQLDSDDAASETSSVGSEHSHSSYGTRQTESSDADKKYPNRRKSRGRSRTYSSGYGVTEDIHSIMAELGSSSHLDRKDGLLSLQHLLRCNRCLNRVELKKITEMFTRMFHDPHNKVFTVFLDTLVELVYLQSVDLADWLHILLPRLLTKSGGEMLGSVANKVQKALDVIRDCFPFDLQFNTVSKFILDQAQGPNLRVRVSALIYLHSLILSMDPSDFVNSMDARLAVSKVISWTIEPRNADVRKYSQSVLIAMFNLNPAEFSVLLSELPKTFQDGATRILHSHIKSTHEGTPDVLSPRSLVLSPGQQNRSRPPSRLGLSIPDNFEAENLNPEDVFNSIKKTSADIQSLNKLEMYGDGRKRHDFTSQDSGIQDVRPDSPDGSDQKKIYFHLPQKSGSTTMNAATFFTKKDSTMSSEDVGKAIIDVLEELSNHNERVEQRKSAMYFLQNLIEKGFITDNLLEENFKSLLLILLETLGDTNGDIKVLALKCLQKMLQKFPKHFEGFAELTILKVLELHKDDTYRDVPYAASEVEDTFVQALPPEQNFRILSPIIQTMEYHMACGAIQMMTKVVDKMPTDLLEASLASLIPGLFKNFEHKESPVRKASCFCLVAIYLRVEEAMRPYMDTLNSHRMKLLNLYIRKRKQEENK